MAAREGETIVEEVVRKLPMAMKVTEQRFALWTAEHKSDLSVEERGEWGARGRALLTDFDLFDQAMQHLAATSGDDQNSGWCKVYTEVQKALDRMRDLTNVTLEQQQQ